MMFLSRTVLVLAVLFFASTAHAYTYSSPLSSTGATTVSAQRCTGAQVAAIGTASGTGAAPSTDSVAWGLLSSNYSGGLPASYNNGSYCIQAALTVTTGGGGGGGGGRGGDGDLVMHNAAFLAFFGIEEAFAQSSSWSIAYTVHSGTGQAALADRYALTYTPSSTPTATLNAPSPSTIAQGSSSALTWSSTNATSCTGTNFSTGGATSGTVSVSPSTTTTYSVTCGGGGATSAAASRTVTVTSPPAGPTATLTASPTEPAGGQSVTLTWSSTNAVSCTSAQFDTEGATSGTETVTPTGTTTYSITCTGDGTTGSGTWQYLSSDTTDLACPWTDMNRPYPSMDSCASGTPPTGSCTNPPDDRCKINSGSCNAINTDIYACTVSGPPPSASDDAVVTMTGISATLSADQLNVEAGDTVTLTWSTSGAQYCTAQEWPFDENRPVADSFNNSSQATSGSDVVRVNEDMQYGIYCYGPGFGNEGGGGGSCSPQSALYNPTCNANYEPRDISCPDGYSVEITEHQCLFGRGQGSNNNDFYYHASCVPCEEGTSSGGDAGSGSDWAFDTVEISISESVCEDNADNDGDGLIDSADPSCTSCTGPTCDGLVENPPDALATISCTVDSTSVPIGGQTTYRTGGTATTPYTWTPSAQTNCSGTSTRTCTFPNAGGPYSMSVQGTGAGSPSIICPNVSASGCSGSPSASLTVNGVEDRIRVKDNSSATISWTFENISTGNCSVSGTDGLSQTLVPNACTQTTASTNQTISTQVIYTLSCPGATDDTVLVNVDSGSGEF